MSFGGNNQIARARNANTSVREEAEESRRDEDKRNSAKTFGGSSMDNKSVKFTVRFAVLILGVMLAMGGNAWGQFSASLTGTVEDSTGAIIPGATVMLVNLGTQATSTATSTGEGSFRFNQLPPAHYKLTVTANGFKTSTVGDVEVAAETPRNVDVKLEAGGASE